MHEENRLITLEERLQKIVKSENLWKDQDQLFLACSGGVDSVVLAHLLHAIGFSFEITLWLLKNWMGRNGICCNDFTSWTFVFIRVQNSLYTKLFSYWKRNTLSAIFSNCFGLEILNMSDVEIKNYIFCKGN